MVMSLFWLLVAVLLVCHILEMLFGFEVKINFFQEYSRFFAKKKEECARYVVFHFLMLKMDVELYGAGIYDIDITVMGLRMWIHVYRQKDQDEIIERLKKKLTAFPKGENVSQPPTAA